MKRKRSSMRMVRMGCAGVLAAVLFGCATPQDPPPEGVAALVEKANVALVANDYQQARETATDAIAAGHESADLYFIRGQALAGLGFTDEALADYAVVVEKMPTLEPRVTSLRYPLLMKKKDWDAAVADLKVLLAGSPRSTELQLAMGRCRMAQGEWNEAVRWLGAAEPGLADDVKQQVNRDRAVCLFKLSKYQEARTMYMTGYFEPKQAAGLTLTDQDFYLAGVMADVNLDDAARDRFWSQLSPGFKRAKGIE